MKLNRKGYMLVEIVIASVLAMGIGYYLLNLTYKFKNNSEDIYAEEDELQLLAIPYVISASGDKTFLFDFTKANKLDEVTSGLYDLITFSGHEAPKLTIIMM